MSGKYCDVCPELTRVDDSGFSSCPFLQRRAPEEHSHVCGFRLLLLHFDLVDVLSWLATHLCGVMRFEFTLC